MAVEITMPRLSDTMEQGTVVKWNVAEGDTVSSGDVIADIETDKATMELQSFEDGTIAKLVVAEGEQVAVGTVIAVVAEEGEDVGAAAASGGAAGQAAAGQSDARGSADDQGPASSTSATSSTSSTSAVAGPPASAPGPAPGGTSNGTPAPAGSGSGSGGRIFASPLARKIASERGIDLGTLNGSGPAGRIVRRDVEQAAAGSAAPAAASAAPALPTVSLSLESKNVPLSNMRGTIARRLVESKQSIPHYQVTVSARMDAVLALRAQLNEQLESVGVKLSVNDFLVRACALAMHKHPYVNASWNDRGPSIDLHAQVNIGIAIALPEERGGGLVVATIRDANRKGLRQISEETKALARKARERGLTIEEMSDSTFTISNLGMYGVDHFTAIINPPNAAILAVARAIEKPFIEYNDAGEAEITVGSEMAMTMSNDHRIVDGAMSAQYLGTVKDYLENPATLLV